MREKNLQIFSIVACLLLVFFTSNITFSQWTLVGAVSDAGPHPCISVVDESTVFIFGGPEGQPKVFRSTDGGINFTELGNTGLGNIELTCGWAVDTSLIFAGNGGSVGGIGGNASFYKSTDGGTTWTVIDTTGGTSGFFNGIVFSRTTPMFGVAESDAADGPGNPFLIWITADGGSTWTKTTAPSVPGANFSVVNSIMVIDDQFYGFGLWSSTSQIYMTTDGGAYWSVGELGIVGDFVYGFAFSEDKMRGIAGTPYALPTIARTSNEGVTWDAINTNTGITNSDWYGPTCKWIPYTDVCYLAGGLGPDGVIAKSMDGGLTWTAMSTSGLTDIFHMEFYSAATTDAVTAYGYAVTGDDMGAVRVLKLVDILSDTLHVPADYSTIQEGIDAANNADIVLVADGTYNENINYKGKAITVASHFLVDGDTSHISNTIIDGSQPSHPDSGSVVYFESGEDTTSILCGFTITGGTGTIVVPNLARGGGGVLCNLSGAKICHNRITNNVVNYDFSSGGGGITSGPPGSDAMIIVENNWIQSNLTEGANITESSSYGAGLALHTHCRVTGNIILDNVASAELGEAWGGGLATMIANYILVNNNIVKGNKALTNSTTELGVGGGMYFLRDSTANLRVMNNIISNNEVRSEYKTRGAGIGFDRAGNYGGDVLFANNIVYGNYSTGSGDSRGGGIYLWKSTVKVFNNTITTNSSDFGGGLYSGDSETSVVMNSIFWGDTSNSEVYIVGIAPEIVYSDIQGGWSGERNIDKDPIFVDQLNSDYHLQDTSPCIQTAIDSYEFAGVMHYCPPYDIEGYPRPYPVGTDPDMGAYEYQFLVGIEENLSSIVPDAYSLAQNYPNPFNPTTTINYGLKERSFVELKIYDVLGREVTLLINEEQDAGYYELNFNAASLASGVYLYQLRAGSFVETKKMILLK